MSTVNDHDGFSVLSNIEEHMIAINFFVLTPISIALCFTIFIILLRDIKLLAKDEDNIYPRYVMHCACAATVSALLGGITVLLFCNDMIIGWNYTVSSNHMLVTVTESMILCSYMIVKVSFYFGFTFHLQSIVYSWNNNPLPTCLKLSMVLFTLYSIASTAVVIYDDATVFAEREIGVTLKHNIHLTMVLSHDKNVFNIVQYLSLGSIVIDLLYFGVLIFLFSVTLKKMDDLSREKGAKCLVLMIISCALFWVFLVSNVLNLPFKYAASSLDGMTNCICLFLLFDSGQIIYNNFCGCLSCHICVGKIFYGSNYNPLPLTSDTTDDDTRADALLHNYDL